MSRCQHSGPNGQCSRPAVDGSEFCLQHSKESDRIRGYRLADESLRERFNQMKSENGLETVRDEVRLLRAMIEERTNMARTEAEKIVAFQVIHPAISTLNKLVESLSKLERQTNAVLSKEALNKLCEGIAQILIEELKEVDGYTEIVDRVAARISDAIAEARNKE